MTAYDQRQFRLMHEYIEAYRLGAISLRALIDGLSALLDVLESAGDSWKARFRSEWWTLEQVYASSLDRNQGQLRLDDEERQLVRSGLTNLSALLQDVLVPQDQEEDPV